jgi:hypothetical protein
MSETCGCPPEAGSAVCGLPTPIVQRPSHSADLCPECGQKGKPVQGQTVKGILSVSLREVREVEYLFCPTRTCPVVYFSPDGAQTFTTTQVRERVYQKEPEGVEVSICYCFRHTVGEVRAASPERRAAILDNINAGIRAGECACDLRNPQGSCCLGNVRRLIQEF